MTRDASGDDASPAPRCLGRRVAAAVIAGLVSGFVVGAGGTTAVLRPSDAGARQSARQVAVAAACFAPDVTSRELLERYGVWRFSGEEAVWFAVMSAHLTSRTGADRARHDWEAAEGVCRQHGGARCSRAELEVRARKACADVLHE